MRPLVLRVLGCCVAVALTACTGPAEPAGATVDPRVRDGLARLYAGDEGGDERESRCFADELLATATLDELREAGLVDESGATVDTVPRLPEEFAGTFVDAQLACTDLVEDSTEAQFTLSKGALDKPAYAACLSAAVSADQQRAALVAAVSGAWDDPALAAFSAAQARCARKSGAG